MEGNAHVLVRRCPLGSEADMSQQMLELWTAWIDLNVSDRAHDEQSLASARARMWRLYQHGHSSSTPAAVTAQMCGSAFATRLSTTSSPSSHGDARGLSCSEAHEHYEPHRGPRDRGDSSGCLQGQGSAQAESSLTRSQPTDEVGSPGPPATRRRSGRATATTLLQPHKAILTESGSHVNAATSDCCIHPGRGVQLRAPRR